jgi:hypothetical protein
MIYAWFQQKIGCNQDVALQAPAVITKHERAQPVLISAALYEILTKGRVARQVEDLDDDRLEAIASATVPDEHAALDLLIEDGTPWA